MSLDDRKKLILRAIVEDYIKNAEPVGSRSLSKTTGLNLSPATIRNEMGDLEDMGLLAQPHTSAGRIPTGLGFRYYVDSLMKQYEMTTGEIADMKRIMVGEMRELDDIVKEVSAAFSAITNLPTFGLIPVDEYGTVKNIKIVGIDNRTIMAIVSDSSGLIKNKLLRLRQDIDDECINELTQVLNDNLVGVKRKDINLDRIVRIQSAVGDNLEIMTSVLQLVHDAMDEMEKNEVYMEGASNILRFPEYNSVEKIKEILEVFDDKSTIGLMADMVPKDMKKGINIYIGDENPMPQLKSNSVIFSSYSMGGNMTGIIGVIGPVRMDYAKVVSGMKFFSEQLSRLFDESETDDKRLESADEKPDADEKDEKET